jgi:hypothetical protein
MRKETLDLTWVQENQIISYIVGEHSHQICTKLSRVVQVQFVALGEVGPTLVLW